MAWTSVVVHRVVFVAACNVGYPAYAAYLRMKKPLVRPRKSAPGGAAIQWRLTDQVVSVTALKGTEGMPSIMSLI